MGPLIRYRISYLQGIDDYSFVYWTVPVSKRMVAHRCPGDTSGVTCETTG